MAAPRFGVCARIYGDAPLDATLERIAAAGYDGVEIPGEPARFDPGEVRRALARHGLAAIGAPLAQMLPSGEGRLAPLATEAEEWAWSVEGMRRAAIEAERLGVGISVEPLNRYEAYLVTSVADAARYLAAVGSPWVGMTVDLFHANLEEPDVAQSLLAAGPRLLHLHAADTNRQGLGRGHLDVGAVAGAIRRIGYRGAVALEVMPPGPNPFRSIKDERSAGILDGYLRESLAALRRHWEGAAPSAG